MNKPLQHILILTPGFPENESDTTCMPPLQVFFKYLAKLNPHVKISVITVNYPFTRGKYQWHGIEVNALGLKHSGSLDIRIPVKILLSVRRLNKTNRIDIIHSFFFSFAFYGNLLSRIFGIPHVITVVGREGSKKSMKTKLINLSDMHIVTLSDFHNQSFYKTFNRNSDSIIPFGLDSSEFPELHPQKRTIDILGVGSLYPVKNFSLFVDIIKRLVVDFPELKTCIIGEGIEHEMLQKKIDNSGISRNITLTGEKKREAVLTQMLQSRIFLHTSQFESQGYVFYEALYAGCLLVSAPIGVAKASDNWKIYNTEDEMFEILKNLLNAEPKYQKETPFLVRDTVNAYLSIYKILIDREKKHGFIKIFMF